MFGWSWLRRPCSNGAVEKKGVEREEAAERDGEASGVGGSRERSKASWVAVAWSRRAWMVVSSEEARGPRGERELAAD